MTVLAISSDIVLVTAVVAAVGAVVGIALQIRNSKTQDEMAEDIERLADLTQSSLEEARLHRGFASACPTTRS